MTDAKPIEAECAAGLRANLVTLQLDPAAIDWLMRVYDAIQFLDDVVDGTPIPRAEADRAIWDLLIALPLHPFYRDNLSELSALMSTAILKWQASDRLERDGKAGPVTFVWRAGFYDLVLAAFRICHGPEAAIANAHLVVGLYGDTFQDYQKEFPPCPAAL